MYAIIETGGKQYKVAVGDVLSVEKLEIAEGNTVELNRVLSVVDAENILLGKPYLENANVTAKVVEHGKGKKIRIFKYKAKSNYRKRMGHRQPYTKLLIENINK